MISAFCRRLNCCKLSRSLNQIPNMTTKRASTEIQDIEAKKSKSENAPDKNRIVWVDLEMTGLDINTCHIIEMACLVTDGQLNIVAEGPELVIHQSDEVLDSMNDWCKEHHGKSGLTQKVKDSKVSLKEAETEMLTFIEKQTIKGASPLGGNSIHADKMFLDKYMPDFMKQLHYRIVDVSTIKELCRRWYPDALKNAPKKKESHRALDDIIESIEELKYYRNTIFKNGTPDGDNKS